MNNTECRSEQNCDAWKLGLLYCCGCAKLSAKAQAGMKMTSTPLPDRKSRFQRLKDWCMAVWL